MVHGVKAGGMIGRSHGVGKRQKAKVHQPKTHHKSHRTLWERIVRFFRHKS
jgi:hypothetical protein